VIHFLAASAELHPRNSIDHALGERLRWYRRQRVVEPFHLPTRGVTQEAIDIGQHGHGLSSLAARAARMDGAELAKESSPDIPFSDQVVVRNIAFSLGDRRYPAMPKATNLDSLIAPVIEHFAQQLAAVVERFTTDRVTAATKTVKRAAPVGRFARTGARGRAAKRCYFPGCNNVAAPRFGMFCAIAHKNLSTADKKKYRAKYLKKKAA
jgi:hypothetical protein